MVDFIANNDDFEHLLKGEFTGRIYSFEKFKPVIESLRKNAELAEFVKNLEKVKNPFIYFNCVSKKIFAIRHQISNGKLKVEVLKPDSQDMTEVRSFGYRLAKIFPVNYLTITEKYSDMHKLESA